MNYKDAFEICRKEILQDRGFFFTWQSNIAMSFYDEMTDNGFNFPKLRDMCNNAAKTFLNLLLSPPAGEEESAATTHNSGYTAAQLVDDICSQYGLYGKGIETWILERVNRLNPPKSADCA